MGSAVRSDQVLGVGVCLLLSFQVWNILYTLKHFFRGQFLWSFAPTLVEIFGGGGKWDSSRKFSQVHINWSEHLNYQEIKHDVVTEKDTKIHAKMWIWISVWPEKKKKTLTIILAPRHLYKHTNIHLWVPHALELCSVCGTHNKCECVCKCVRTSTNFKKLWWSWRSDNPLMGRRPETFYLNCGPTITELKNGIGSDWNHILTCQLICLKEHLQGEQVLILYYQK